MHFLLSLSFAIAFWKYTHKSLNNPEKEPFRLPLPLAFMVPIVNFAMTKRKPTLNAIWNLSMAANVTRVFKDNSYFLTTWADQLNQSDVAVQWIRCVMKERPVLPFV
jgi:hypothetical protein